MSLHCVAVEFRSHLRQQVRELEITNLRVKQLPTQQDEFVLPLPLDFPNCLCVCLCLCVCVGQLSIVTQLESAQAVSSLAAFPSFAINKQQRQSDNATLTFSPPTTPQRLPSPAICPYVRQCVHQFVKKRRKSFEHCLCVQRLVSSRGYDMMIN